MNTAAIYSAIRGVIEGRLGSVRTVPAGALELGLPVEDDDHDRARWLRAQRAPRYDVAISPPARSDALGPWTCDRSLNTVDVVITLCYPLVRLGDMHSAARFAVRSGANDTTRLVTEALSWPGNLAADESGTPLGLVSQCLVPVGEPIALREDWDAGIYEVELRLMGRVQRAAATPEPPAFVRAPAIYVVGAEAAEVGGTLIADPGEAVRASSLAGQWLRDGADISDETAVRYEIVTDDEGTALSYRSTATGPGGVVSADSQAIVVAGDTPWDPGDIAGYAFDYDAESYAGGTLLDLSGNGRDLSQADPAKRPAQVSRNGRLALHFDGTQRLDGVMGTMLGQPLTIYLVSEIPDRTVTQHLISTDGVRVYSASSGYRVGAQSVFVVSAHENQSAMSAVVNGASSAAYVDDFTSPAASGDSGAGGMSTLTLGGTGATATSLVGYIWRVIGYSGAHDAPTRKLMGDYLAARYSIPIVT